MLQKQQYLDFDNLNFLLTNFPLVTENKKASVFRRHLTQNVSRHRKVSACKPQKFAYNYIIQRGLKSLIKNFLRH